MKTEKIDLVDFHSHILPKADHGSSSMEITEKQLELASMYSVNRIIATPHFYPHRHTLPSFKEKILNSVDILKNRIVTYKPTVKLGYEVLLCEGIEKFPGISELTLKGSDYILIELPFSDFREEYCISCQKLQDLGMKVILAHVDRYPKENIDLMLQYGINRFQVNASAFDRLFVPKHLYEYCDNGYVVALGSDIHGDKQSYYKSFNKAKSKLSMYIDSIKQRSDEIWNTVSEI